MGECRRENLNWTTSPEKVKWKAKQPTTTAPSAHTSQLITDLLHEPSEAVLLEELVVINKTLDPKAPISWLKEILRTEMWEEELFQGGDIPLPPGLQMICNQWVHQLGTHDHVPEITITGRAQLKSTGSLPHGETSQTTGGNMG